ncbi:MAG TPA: DMT family transporter, partial [Armatimonadota bacterium]|nr:DMT family transporter [Armatimonadota bacterium]
MPILFALLAAVCFGITTPFAKLLLGNVAPVPLAALLYLGSGVSLAAFIIGRRLLGHQLRQEARLERSDLPWLLGAVVSGGVAAPIVLMFALRATPAATASLLLNFESVATTLIAAFAFREYVGARVWWAVLLVTAAC